jgi:hypothetical protein
MKSNVWIGSTSSLVVIVVVTVLSLAPHSNSVLQRVLVVDDQLEVGVVLTKLLLTKKVQMLALSGESQSGSMAPPPPNSVP